MRHSTQLLGSQHTLLHEILSAVQWGSFCLSLHFTNEGTEAQRFSGLLKTTAEVYWRDLTSLSSLGSE